MHEGRRGWVEWGGTGCVWVGLEIRGGVKLQALVYDILPSTTVVFSYAIGSGKLSVNEQFMFKLF